MGDLPPDLRLRGRGRLELDRALEQGDGILDLVAADGQLGCAAKPGDGALAQVSELLVGPGPGEVDVFRSHRLRVVVGQQSRMLVSTLPRPLEPGREPRMEVGALRGRQASIGDFTGECVLDHELSLPDERGTGAVANEVALLEQAKVRLDVLEQLVDGT